MILPVFYRRDIILVSKMAYDVYGADANKMIQTLPRESVLYSYKDAKGISFDTCR